MPPACRSPAHTESNEPSGYSVTAAAYIVPNCAMFKAANVGWLPQGVVATGPANGATKENVILADINGDGRADYLTVTHTGGVVELWINGGGPNDGPNAAQVVWYPQGVIATGVGTSGAGVQFAELNGDGRAEYLDVNYLTSAVNAWLNGCA
ncbi:hypothetical protein B0H12DRAFT_1235677 [Mycena haematopus]|nr:hypothetical protein B0H12DRAFT_1235677 [Mycena haematopus]